MAATGNEEPKPLRRKRDIENWANKDLLPTRPNPGQILQQKKRKTG